MKKLIALGIAVLMVLGISALSHADVIETSKSVSVLLGVDSQFGFEIWDPEFAQTLPNVLPGVGETGDIHFYVTSNHSVPWYLKAASDGLEGQVQASPDTLPVLFTTFDGGGGAIGTYVDNLLLTGTAANVYSSGVGEAPCSGLEVAGIFTVNTLLTTKQDLYSGTIQLTMTE